MVVMGTYRRRRIASSIHPHSHCEMIPLPGTPSYVVDVGVVVVVYGVGIGVVVVRAYYCAPADSAVLYVHVSGCFQDLIWSYHHVMYSTIGNTCDVRETRNGMWNNCYTMKKMA
jgi:hypothetical protein